MITLIPTPMVSGLLRADERCELHQRRLLSVIDRQQIESPQRLSFSGQSPCGSQSRVMASPSISTIVLIPHQMQHVVARFLLHVLEVERSLDASAGQRHPHDEVGQRGRVGGQASKAKDRNEA